jgi:excisionase family DNA binding protein
VLQLQQQDNRLSIFKNQNFQKMETNVYKEVSQRLANIEAMLAGTKKVLTLDELAAYSGLAKSTIYKLTSTNQIPHYKPNGRYIYFDRDEINAWLLRNEVPTAAQQSMDAATYVTLKPSKA